MILEEETYEKFGYYPSELTPKSGKKILAACDDCGKVREVKKCDYRLRCPSCAQKRKKISTETREKISIAKLKYPLLNDRKWIERKYYDEELSVPRIASIIGCHKETVYNALKRLNIAIVGHPVGGKRNPNYGKHFGEDSKRKMREAKKGKYTGKNHPMYGKHLSEATKKKIGDANKGRESARKGKTIEEEYGVERADEIRKAIREARKHQRIPKHHTIPERIFESFAEKFDIGAEYTGDSKFWIGNLNPDFIIRKKRIAIFVNGDYWHSPLLRPDMSNHQRADYQVKVCKKHKWKAIIIWESDLKRKDAEAFVLATLKKEGVI